MRAWLAILGIGIAASPPRRKMLSIVAAATVLTLANLGFDLVGPLWATAELGLEEIEWARLRSMRFWGSAVGAASMIAVAERFGARRLGQIAFILAGAAFVLLAWGPLPLLQMVMLSLGASISLCYVSLNALTQSVSQRRPGLANGVYRTTAAAAAIVAPVAAALLATRWGSYVPVLAMFGLTMCAGGAALLFHPRPAVASRQPNASLWTRITGLLRERRLMDLIVLESLTTMANAGMIAYTALRLSHDLGWSGPAIGLMFTAAAGCGLVAAIIAGATADRIPLHLQVGFAVAMQAIGALGFACATDAELAVASLLLHAAGGSMAIVPFSMGIGRQAPGERATVAFAVHKTIQASCLALGLAFTALVTPRLGMSGVVVVGGMLSALLCLLALVMLRRTPPPPRTESSPLADCIRRP